LAGQTELPEPAPAQFFARRSSYPWLVVGTVCIGGFIGQVDASIVQLAMPAFEDSFDAGLDAVTWVAVGYVLAYASLLPVFGRLAETAGRKTMYLCGFALFGLFSALCGLAANLPLLIVFRLLQGVAGAMMGANSVVILVAAAGQTRRGKALGVLASAQAVGLSLGPTVGGLILGTLSWPWIFWVTVPFAVLGVLFAWLIVPKTTSFAKDRRFDAPGALLLVPALVALLILISECRAWGLSPALLVCAAAVPILLGAFIWRETRAPSPLIDLHLFRSPAFSAGCVGVLLSYSMLYGIFFAVSFALIRGYREPAISAGLRLTIIPVALGLVAPFGGAASDRYPRLIMLAGMGFCAASALALIPLLTGTRDSLLGVMAALAAYGVGLGLYIAPNNNATVSAAPPDKSGVAGGLLNLLRVLGAGVGVATASTALSLGLEGSTQVARRTSGASQAALLGAVGDVMIMLAAFAALSAVAAIVRSDVKRAGSAAPLEPQVSGR
jgi:EmrB/QacA subfamily drug resistance transporter